MFVGHYGVSFATKKADASIPLWVLFVAVQWLDVMWAPLILLGIEKVRIVPGFTATNPLDLYHMPYTHNSLEGLLLLGAIAIYVRESHAWRLGIIGFGMVMLGIQAYIFFGPPPASSAAAAGTALGAYAVFALVIWFLGDRVVIRQVA